MPTSFGKFRLRSYHHSVSGRVATWPALAGLRRRPAVTEAMHACILLIRIRPTPVSWRQSVFRLSIHVPATGGQREQLHGPYRRLCGATRGTERREWQPVVSCCCKHLMCSECALPPRRLGLWSTQYCQNAAWCRSWCECTTPAGHQVWCCHLTSRSMSPPACIGTSCLCCTHYAMGQPPLPGFFGGMRRGSGVAQMRLQTAARVGAELHPGELSQCPADNASMVLPA